MKKLALLTSLCFGILTTQAQSDLGAWYMSFNTIDIGDRFQFQNDIQYRNFNALGDLEQLLLRGGIGINLSKNNNNLLLGYAFIRSGEIGTENEELETRINESRIYQQFLTNQRFGRFYFTHRYRVEERFLQDDIKFRFRYFLNLRVAINKKEMEKNTFYFSTYNEIFINGQNTMFDRNRLYGAFGFHFHDKYRVDLGVMSQIYQETYRTQMQLGLFMAF